MFRDVLSDLARSWFRVLGPMTILIEGSREEKCSVIEAYQALRGCGGQGW